MFVFGGNQSVGGYEVANSLRFEDGSSDKLTRSTGTPDSEQIFTWSQWVKKTRGDSTYEIIQGFYNNSSNYLLVSFNQDRIDVLNYEGGITARKITTAKFRDVSAWMHIVVAVDTTQGTANNRIKIYVNGVQETVFDTNSAPSLNANLGTNMTTTAIGVGEGGSIGYLSAYLAEVCYIDGTALDPTSFGEFDADTGIWKPIDVSGLTFGTNGFYLDFENSGNLGADVSGNGNNFTVNNLTSIDQTTDTPTNNYATMNPLIPYAGGTATFSEGNLNLNFGGTYGYNFGGFQVSQGKWYWEGKVISISGSYEGTGFGFQDMENLYQANDSYPINDIYVYGNDGRTRDPTNGVSAFGNSYTTNDIIGIAMDLDNGYGYFSKNGTWQNSGDPTSGASGTGSAFSLNPSASGQFFAPYVADDSTTTSSVEFALNFGNPTFSISSGNSDGNGYGNFEYSVPSGYYALNTKNLAEYG